MTDDNHVWGFVVQLTTKKIITMPLLAILLLMLHRIAAAADFNYALEYDLEHSDNVGLTVDDSRESAIINTALLGANYEQTGRSWDVLARGTGAYRRYSRDIGSSSDSDNDENIYDGQARMQWHISPHFFSWMVEDYLRHTTINALATESPTNRQQSNMLMTGPNWYIRPSSVDTFTLTARHGKQEFSEAGADNERRWATTNWEHRISAVMSAAAQYEIQYVRYQDDDTSPDYDRRDAHAQLLTHAGVNQWHLDYGKTRIERIDDEPIEDDRWSASWRRLFGYESSMSVSFRKGYSDAGMIAIAAGVEALANAIPAGGLDVVVGDLIDERSARFDYQRRQATGNLQWYLYDVEREFEQNAQLNERSRGIGGLYDLALSDLWNMQIRADHNRTEYTTVSRQDKEEELMLRFTRLISPNTSFAVSYSFRDSRSNDAEFEFKENRVMFLIRYQRATTIQ